MKKNFIFAAFFTIFFVLIFNSCSPKISVAAENDNSIKIGLSTSIPEEIAKELRQIFGMDKNIPIFAETDVKNLISQIGAKSAEVSILSPNEMKSSGKISNISENVLATCNFVLKTENSLSIFIGPEQFKNLYNLLNDEYKSYLDLLMIPGLTNEKLQPSEYEELLSAMYGPGIAKDIVSSKLEISLSSPDGKVRLNDSAALGEILTLDKTKVWKISW